MPLSFPQCPRWVFGKLELELLHTNLSWEFRLAQNEAASGQQMKVGCCDSKDRGSGPAWCATCSRSKLVFGDALSFQRQFAKLRGDTKGKEVQKPPWVHNKTGFTVLWILTPVFSGRRGSKNVQLRILLKGCLRAHFTLGERDSYFISVTRCPFSVIHCVVIYQQLLPYIGQLSRVLNQQPALV